MADDFIELFFSFLIAENEDRMFQLYLVALPNMKKQITYGQFKEKSDNKNTMKNMSDEDVEEMLKDFLG